RKYSKNTGTMSLGAALIALIVFASVSVTALLVGLGFSVHWSQQNSSLNYGQQRICLLTNLHLKIILASVQLAWLVNPDSYIKVRRKLTVADVRRA
ncbi:hypothetical protein BOX15_Mlig007361g3, partial [Macrostomum lignano]